MTRIVIHHEQHNGHYARLAPSVIRLHSTFGPSVRRPHTWRELAFDVVFRFGLPALAFLFFVLAVVGLIVLLAALGRAARVLSGG